MSVSVVYWSGTGNTQAMAEAVAEGIRKEDPAFRFLWLGRRRVDERLDGAHEECRCCTCER